MHLSKQHLVDCSCEPLRCGTRAIQVKCVEADFVSHSTASSARCSTTSSLHTSEPPISKLSRIAKRSATNSDTNINMAEANNFVLLPPPAPAEAVCCEDLRDDAATSMYGHLSQQKRE